MGLSFKLSPIGEWKPDGIGTQDGLSSEPATLSELSIVRDLSS